MKVILEGICRWGWLSFILAVSVSYAEDTKPVSRDELKTVIRVLKKTMERVNQLEKENKELKQQGAGPAPAVGKEEAVNLTQMGAGGAAEKAAQSSAMNYGSQLPAGAGATPTFKTFFDFLFVNRPGVNNLSFDSYHSWLFFEIIPTPNLMFTFDVNPTAPKYFELDYNITKRVQIRVGKIWIPYDDMAPHNIFGGRVNVSRLSLGAAYLPDIWTDLGVGLRMTLMDTFALQMIGDLYVVNGFRSGGQDPTNGAATPNQYPLFSDLPATGPDNNRDKAIGGRLHALFAKRLGVGASFYTDRWSDETDPSYRLNIIGLDAQFRPYPRVEFRAGYSAMFIQSPGGSFDRGGFYGEAGWTFSRDSRWKVLFRGGEIQLDNRVIQITDERLVGATILYNPGMVQLSLESSRDLEQVAGKPTYSYTAARVVMAF